MRVIEKDQVLTTGILNANGVVIHTDSVDWGEYLLNPVLLYNAESEGHYGVAVGTVTNIRREGDAYVGKLNFMDKNADADIAYEKYKQGVLRFTSIGGFAAGYEDEDGVFHTTRYKPRENSLVKFPANLECGQVDVKKLDNDANKAYQSMLRGVLEGEVVRYVTMSADVASIEEYETNANEKNMEKVKQIDVPVEANADTATVDVPVEANADTATVDVPVEANADTATVDVPVEANADTATVDVPVEANADTATVDVPVEANADTATVDVPVEANADTATVDVPVEANADTATVDIQTNASAESPLPKGMAWHEQNASNNNKLILSTMDYKELNASADFQKRLNSLNSAFRAGAPKADNLPENTETVQILASAMLADADMVILASRTNVTNDVTRDRKNGLDLLVDCAAGNATAATLAVADLGVIKYLSLFFEQLLANDTFRRSIRFVPMSDRTGSIYIEDAVSAPIAVGNNTPINAPIYTYEDVKRTIARRVFSFAPMLFQHSELAVLAYAKQSHGTKTTMSKLMQGISTYWLQTIANTVSIARQGTTGATISTANLFPIEAPNSAVNVKKPTLTDIVALEGLFLMQNYNLSGKRIECVLPSNVYTMLAGDEEVRNKLIKELNGNLATHIDFSATRITPRNPVARFNTASGLAELDTSMYADKNVDDNGAMTDITPAITTADHIGAGVAFVEGEVIAGIGAIELIVSPSPQNYGTVISGWVSTGCTVARQNGVGAALVIPSL